MKLTIKKAIKKSILLWNVEVGRVPILYMWIHMRENYDFVRGRFIMIDRDLRKMEWYVSYITDDKIYSSTIDDMTGNATIQIVER